MKKAGQVHTFKKVTYGLCICKDPYTGKTRKLKKDDTLDCTEDYFSPRLRKQFVCISDPSVGTDTDKGLSLKVEPDKDNLGKFNIINPLTGKAINDIPMDKEKAEEVSGVSCIVDEVMVENSEDEEKKVVKPKKKITSKKKK